MKSTRKFIFAVIAATLSLVLCLSACGSPAAGNSAPASSAPPPAPSAAAGPASAASPAAPATSDKKLQVYLISVMSGGAAWGQCEIGFMDACKELGWEGHFLAPQSANTLTDLVNLTDTAITNGADILMPCVIDNDAFADVLQRAKDAKIPMIGMATKDDHLNAWIGTDPTGLGNAMAEALVRACGDEPIKVITMQTLLTSTIQNAQADAFEKKLKELRPNAVLISREECNSNAATASDKVAALKLANPDLNALISLDSYAGLGGAAFVEEKGLQGKFHVVGIDDAPEILRAVQEKTMDCAVAQMWYNIGYNGTYLAKDAYEGKTIAFDNDAGTKIIFPEDIDAWVKERGIDMTK